MKNSILIFSSLFTALLCAENINVQNNGVINNYGSMNNTQNNYEVEKAEFETKIDKLATSILNKPGQQNQQTISAVIEGAKKANVANIPSSIKKERCVEHALSLKLWKVDAKIARNECEKIFAK